MPNAKDASINTISHHKILAVGGPGSGKTSQLWTLPGKKFAYIFDPNAVRSFIGLDIDYEEFYPTAAEMDPFLKGFNKNAHDDKPKKPAEPLAYLRWTEDFNKRVEAGFFATIDWLIFDSLTLFTNILMARQLFINGRYGDIEDQADYRIAGNKLWQIFSTIAAVPTNLYCTSHLNTYQDDKTKRIMTQIDLPGSARRKLPIIFSNIWEFRQTQEDKQEYVMLTKAEPRGFQDIRTTVKGLSPVEDVTIKDFTHPERYGVGKILTAEKPRVPVSSPSTSQTTAAQGVRSASDSPTTTARQ